MNMFTNPFSNSPDALTQNGALTYSTSSDVTTDLFSIIGAIKSNADVLDVKILKMFEESVRKEPSIALRLLLWARDCRGGAGRRKVFRDLFSHLETFYPAAVKNLIPYVAEYGRYDDLISSIKNDDNIEVLIKYLVAELDTERAPLVAKWIKLKSLFAVRMANSLNLSAKSFRKLIVSKRADIVETKMCSNKWDDIDFSKVPSIATARYSKAFFKHSTDGKFEGWVKKVALNDPSVKINTQTLYPADVIRQLRAAIESKYRSVNGSIPIQSAQNAWDNLPNFVDGNYNILPIVDVSGSMTVNVQGSMTAMDISVSLGLYLANKNSGEFKNLFMTFSSRPEFVKVSGTSLEKDYEKTISSNWQMSTNIQAAFNKILEHARNNSVPQKDMPKYILIISDMEFDSCGRNTNYNVFKSKFEECGYDLPKVIFWNVNASVGNVPVRYNTDGVALVSGYSPAIMKSILNNNLEKFSPRGVMEATLNSERYLKAVPQF